MIYKVINKKLINLINNSNLITIELYNTKSLNSKILNSIINRNCYFKIYGGINDIEYIPRYKKRITYHIDEIKEIITEFEKIEENIPNNKMDKILYIYDYIRKNIKYDSKEENDLLIRSLRVIITKQAVCSGYSLLFKELLERQNIKCEYVKYFNHIWNRVYLNKKIYEIDLTWDACVYKKCPSSNLHFFANNRNLDKEHHNEKKRHNYLDNNLIKKYELFPIELKREDNSVFKLTLLPLGFKKKYYIYEEKNFKKIISSDDDFEIIYSRCNKSIISSYVNCFFTIDRIKKYENNNYSYLGYGIASNKCFYRKKLIEIENYIKSIKYKKTSIIINTINGIYEIDDNYEMKEV
ncbi:MAG: transglutaminase domain-containing protein [Bacilli bacterium]